MYWQEPLIKPIWQTIESRIRISCVTYRGHFNLAATFTISYKKYYFSFNNVSRLYMSCSLIALDASTSS